MTVTTTTDPRHHHLSKVEINSRYNYLLQKVRIRLCELLKPLTKEFIYLLLKFRSSLTEALSFLPPPLVKEMVHRNYLIFLYIRYFFAICSKR